MGQNNVQDPPNKERQFYDLLKNSPIKGVPDDYSVFQKAMRDEDKRKAFYDLLNTREAVKGLPDYETFSNFFSEQPFSADQSNDRTNNPFKEFWSTARNTLMYQFPGSLKSGYAAIISPESLGTAFKALAYRGNIARMLTDKRDYGKALAENETASEAIEDFRKSTLLSGMQDMNRYSELQEGAIMQTSQIKGPLDAVNYLFNNIGQQSAQIIPSVLTGGGSSIGQEIGLVYMEQVEKIAEKEGITPEEVIDQGLDDQASAIAWGTLSGSLDAIGAGRVTGMLGKKKLLKELRDKSKTVFQKIREVGKDSAFEGLTEGSQGFIQQIGSSVGAGDSVIQAFTDVDWNQVKEEAIAGATGATGVDVGSRVYNSIREKATNKLDKEIVKRYEDRVIKKFETDNIDVDNDDTTGSIDEIIDGDNSDSESAELSDNTPEVTQDDIDRQRVNLQEQYANAKTEEEKAQIMNELGLLEELQESILSDKPVQNKAENKGQEGLQENEFELPEGFDSSDGGYRVAKGEGGYTVFNKKSKKPVGRTSKKFNSTFAEFITDPSNSFPETDLSDITREDEYIDVVINTSDNPIEIVEAYDAIDQAEELKSQTYQQDELRQLAEDVYRGNRKISLSSLNANIDKSILDDNRIIYTRSSKEEGIALDVKATQMSERLGREITVEDIFEAITERLTTANEFKDARDTAKKRFKAVTGVSLTDKLAEEILNRRAIGVDASGEIDVESLALLDDYIDDNGNLDAQRLWDEKLSNDTDKEFFTDFPGSMDEAGYQKFKNDVKVQIEQKSKANEEPTSEGSSDAENDGEGAESGGQGEVSGESEPVESGESFDANDIDAPAPFEPPTPYEADQTPDSPELKALKAGLDKAIAKYEAAKKAFTTKKKELERTAEDDAIDLFGQRNEDRKKQQSMFDIRANAKETKKALEPYRLEIQQAKEEISKIQKAIGAIQKDGFTGDLFDAREPSTDYDTPTTKLPDNKKTAEQNEDLIKSDSFEELPDNVFDKIRVKLEDQYIDLRRLQDQAEKSEGKQLAEDQDAYLEEELFKGITEQDLAEFDKSYTVPILELVHKLGWSLEKAELYIMARHAEERNNQIAKINETLPDGGSGMTTETANIILDRVENSKDAQMAVDLGAMWDDMVKFQRDLLVASGIIDKETAETWAKTYKHYASLKGDIDANSPAKTGKGFDMLGKLKRATGRTSLADKVFANTMASIKADIVKARKQKVGEALLKFVVQHPNESLYTVDEKKYKPSINKKTGLVQYVPDGSNKLDDNVINVKMNGVDHHITFHSERGKRLAASLKNLGTDNAGIVVKDLHKITRYLALVNTGLNPEFIVTNFARDIQTAMINIDSTQAAEMKKSVLKDVFKARKGMQDYLNGKPNSEWSRHAELFVKSGGKTGWIDAYKSADDYQKSLQKELDRLGRSKKDPRELLNKSLEFIQVQNEAVENSIRLSAFVHARNMGLSDKKAASLAKNLTVNFNRRGQWGPTLNALYLFYGAAVNGNVRIFQAMKSPKARKVVGTFFIGAAMNDIVQRFIGGEDEETGESYYDQIPDWVKERNLIFMIPGTEGKYITIPLPYGYNVIKVAGDQLGSAVSNAAFNNVPGFNAEDMALTMIDSFLGSFNPIGSTASVNQFVAPTVLDPAIQIGENLDWSGRNIYPEPNPYDRSPQPDSELYYRSAPKWSVALAKQMNELTGGTVNRPGDISVSPESLQHWIRFSTGGAGNFLDEFLDTPIKLMNGEQVEPYKVPFLGKVYGSVGKLSTYEDYIKYVAETEYAEADLITARLQKDKEWEAKTRRLYPEYISNIDLAKKTESEIQALNKNRKEIEDSGSITPAEKRERLERIDEQIVKVQKVLIKAINEAKKDGD